MAVTLALGMPANERMDTLVEKATELGAASIQPLMCQRSVLRLSGERAQKKVAHWQAVAVAACEQSGRTRVPTVEPVRTFGDWLTHLPAAEGTQRVVLSFAGSRPVPAPPAAATLCLSGPRRRPQRPMKRRARSEPDSFPCRLARGCCVRTPRRWRCWHTWPCRSLTQLPHHELSICSC